MSKKRLTPSQKDLALNELNVATQLLSSFHETGLYLPTRTIYFGSVIYPDGEDGGVDCHAAESLIKNLHVLELMASDPITILMCSPGGSVYEGLAVYDAIKASPCEVTVKVRGQAMSMASIILQAANKRVMAANSVQLVHYGTEGFSHHSKVFEKYADEGKRVNDWMEQLYMSRINEKQPRMTLRQFKEKIAFDWYLTAEQSIDIGLADEIG